MYLCENIINLFVKTPRFIIAEPYNQTMFIFLKKYQIIFQVAIPLDTPSAMNEAICWLSKH